MIGNKESNLLLLIIGKNRFVACVILTKKLTLN